MPLSCCRSHGCGSTLRCYQLMPRISREAVVLWEIGFFLFLSQPAVCWNCIIQVANAASQHLLYVFLMWRNQLYWESFSLSLSLALCAYICIYIYAHTYWEKERESARARERERETFTYIYIQTCIYIGQVLCASRLFSSRDEWIVDCRQRYIRINLRFF